MGSLTMNPVNRNKGNQVTSGNSLFPFDNSIVEGKQNNNKYHPPHDRKVREEKGTKPSITSQCMTTEGIVRSLSRCLPLVQVNLFN